MAAGADGVHLRSDDISPQEVRAVWKNARVSPPAPQIAVSCHSPAEVAQAAANGATLAVFAPVFVKKNARPAGLAALRETCASVKIPVLGLGGITLSNAVSCLEAGAAGIAAIRLFEENDVADVVNQLREIRV